jgi:hypothetical protein
MEGGFVSDYTPMLGTRGTNFHRALAHSLRGMANQGRTHVWLPGVTGHWENFVFLDIF